MLGEALAPEVVEVVVVLLILLTIASLNLRSMVNLSLSLFGSLMDSSFGLVVALVPCMPDGFAASWPGHELK